MCEIILFYTNNQYLCHTTSVEISVLPIISDKLEIQPYITNKIIKPPSPAE